MVPGKATEKMMGTDPRLIEGKLHDLGDGFTVLRVRSQRESQPHLPPRAFHRQYFGNCRAGINAVERPAAPAVADRWPVTAWLYHFVFENNRPATFKHPLYSLMGDRTMFGQKLAGKMRC